MKIQQDSVSEMDDLIISYLTGSASVEDVEKVQAWLNADPNNRIYFDQLREIYYIGKITKQPSGFDKEKSLERIKRRYYQVKLSEIENKNTQHGWLVRYRIAWTVAATFLLAMGLGFFIRSIIVPDMTKSILSAQLYNEITTPKGARTNIILPDGTKVWLNAGTTLRYPEKFATKQRDVYLSGEAFFKVATNKKRPFIVHTSDITIKALGTAFNVTAYQTDKAVVTTLVEGVVKIESNQNSTEKKLIYTLKPNTKLTYIKKNTKEKQENQEQKAEPVKSITETKLTDKRTNEQVVINENINTILTTSWKDPRWIIKGEPITNLAVLLERRYDIKISIHATNDMDKYVFSGIIENETLEQFLDYLKMVMPIKYTIKKGQVVITLNETTNESYKKHLKQNFQY
jgi:transmembrane sensor